ncbi:MAG TPA: dihydrofolate reductase family protein [Gaiellaceae bacterium]|jgi:dihydrofolate reductase|nr:dihydrofolate reductase family protein [Gaiellaceae bacterium]
MSRLVYSVIASLDGYVSDAAGNFDWAAPDPEVHAFVNELERPIGTYLYGRRMYETMKAWETMPGGPPVVEDYAAIWRGADKVVYSRTLKTVSSARTRLEPEFDAAAVRELKQGSERDLSVGGPELAGHALRAGLVDDCHLLVVPVLVGSGSRAFSDGTSAALELVDERRFGNGTLHLHYRVDTGAPDR